MFSCLKTGLEINSGQWNRRPACYCNHCILFFNALANSQDRSKSLEERKKEVYNQLNEQYGSKDD